MKTLQLGEGWFPESAGGLNRMYYELLRHLPRSGVEVSGLVTGSPRVVKESGGKAWSFAPPTAPLPVRCWAVRRGLDRMLSEQRPDLVAVHFVPYAFPVLDKLRSRPLVFHFHGPWSLEGQAEGGQTLNTRLKAILERIVFRHGTRYITLSQAFRDVLHREYRVPAERIRVVPGGVDVDRFSTGLSRLQAREGLGWPRDRPTVLTVRRLARRMGLENLITAMNAVRERVPEVLLLIAGKGTLHETLSDQIRSLNLENNVRLLGFLPDQDLPLAYRAADLTVVPTVSLEGFGLIVVESLASGTPVLVTPVGGLPEVVSDLSTELVLSGSGAGLLADGIEAALVGDLPLPSAESCRSYARSRYDWPVVTDQVRVVYEEALR